MSPIPPHLSASELPQTADVPTLTRLATPTVRSNPPTDSPLPSETPLSTPQTSPMAPLQVSDITDLNMTSADVGWALTRTNPAVLPPVATRPDCRYSPQSFGATTLTIAPVPIRILLLSKSVGHSNRRTARLAYHRRQQHGPILGPPQPKAGSSSRCRQRLVVLLINSGGQVAPSSIQQQTAMSWQVVVPPAGVLNCSVTGCLLRQPTRLDTQSDHTGCRSPVL
jgi:hypothetical protein